MSTNASLMGRRVMLADAFHLAPFFFVHSRVVSDQIPCDNGWLGTSTTFGALFLLARPFCLHHRRHLGAKAFLPPGHERLYLPRGPCKEAAEATETAPL